jgi:xanthine dehydrogenase YagS FAD-binding subunit
MKNFQYFRPTTIDQALALLEPRYGNTEVLAGGTDLHDLQKEYVAQPSKVVSLTGIAGLKTTNIGDKSVSLGANLTLAEIAGHARLKQWFPALTEAADQIGGPQIRNMGTLGGNLCQRNRCWYFRDEHTPCLLKGGQKCFAIEGENKYHAVFSENYRCVIVNPSTLAPALIALDASAEVQGAGGKRSIKLAEFFKAPVGPADREHVLAANEVVLSVTIPYTGANNASYEVRQKQAYDWPLVQAAVAFQGGKNGANATGVKVVLGHVAPIPVVSAAAASAIEGKAITEETAAAAGRAAAQGAKPLSQNAYKTRLIEVAVKRALLTAAGGAKYWEA